MRNPYLRLMRLDKPIGTWLLLFPTLSALWLAADAMPQWHWIIIFSLGTFLMRSAGCCINDIWDRDIDPHVARTQTRPLSRGELSLKQAIVFTGVLLFLAASLLLFLNPLAILLAFAGLSLTIIYPLMKRYIQAPQLVLSFAFAWGIPMSYAVIQNTLPVQCWIFFTATMCWIMIYDTQYAMADKADDLTIGVNSTAILFGNWDNRIIGILQILMLALLSLVKVSIIYYVSLFIISLLFIYQQVLTAKREPKACFQAFLHNRFVGLTLFSGIALETIA